MDIENLVPVSEKKYFVDCGEHSGIVFAARYMPRFIPITLPMVDIVRVFEDIGYHWEVCGHSYLMFEQALNRANNEHRSLYGELAEHEIAPLRSVWNKYQEAQERIEELVAERAELQDMIDELKSDLDWERKCALRNEFSSEYGR